MTIRADLHIHSCLSPCGDLAMAPRTIAARAAERGLDLIALTDHNTARNVPAFAAACREAGIAALYGTEVTTSEEVHALALFGDPETAVRFGDEVYETLPREERDPERFGDQVVVDEVESIVDTLTSYLIGASAFTLTGLGRRVHELGGLFVPAHIDRSAFSVWSQLGFLPPDDYDAVEITGAAGRIDSGGYPRICSSDAHQPSRIGARSISFSGDRPGFDALASALRANAVSLSLHAGDE